VLHTIFCTTATNKKSLANAKGNARSDACVKARFERNLSSQRCFIWTRGQMTLSAISSAWIPILAENRIFLPTSLSFSVLVRGDPFRIYGKALQFLKLESFRQPMVKIWWSKLAPFLTDPPVWRTDGRTDRIAMSRVKLFLVVATVELKMLKNALTAGAAL